MTTAAQPTPLVTPKTLGLIIAFFIIPYASFFFLFHRFMSRKPARFGSAILLVLGDFGRSPRMMYHAKSLVSHGWETVVIAYCVHQSLSVLYRVFWIIPVHTEFIVVQNPPTIPTLILAQGICLITGSKVIIDWHNEGWSILALRVGNRNPLVRLARWIEGTFGQSAYAHLFVTNALLNHLKKTFDLQGRPAILYDRPPSNFHRTDALHQHELFSRIIPTITPPLPAPLTAPDLHSTIFTTTSNSLATLRGTRPALLVSSTSWTADEDFSLLLTALDSYQAFTPTASDSDSKLPYLLVLITGKGPLRSAFEKAVKERERSGRWTNVTARCVFVEARDYSTLLGCADLGVSLHTSSSGRDLPMKIVDMFGCGVPVLAKGFACLGELVKDGKNGRVFETGEQLGQECISLLSNFPKNEQLQKLQSYVTAQAEKPRSRAGTPVPDPDEWTTWENNWDQVVFNGILRRERR